MTAQLSIGLQMQSMDCARPSDRMYGWTRLSSKPGVMFAVNHECTPGGGPC